MTLIERLKRRFVPMQYSYNHFNDDQLAADMLAEAETLLDMFTRESDASLRQTARKWLAQLRGTPERESE